MLSTTRRSLHCARQSPGGASGGNFGRTCRQLGQIGNRQWSIAEVEERRSLVQWRTLHADHAAQAETATTQAVT